MSEERPYSGIFQKCSKCGFDCKVCDKCGKFSCDNCGDWGECWEDSWKAHPKKHHKCPKCECICIICEKCGKHTCDKCDWGCDCKKKHHKCPKCKCIIIVCEICGKPTCPECDWGCDCQKKHHKCPKCKCIIVICEICGKPTCSKCDWGCDCKKKHHKCPKCSKGDDYDEWDDKWDDSWKEKHKKHFPKCPKCGCTCVICNKCEMFTCIKCDFGCDCVTHCSKCHKHDRDFYICPSCGKDWDEEWDDSFHQPKKHFPKFPELPEFPKAHKEFAKCNLCNCITEGDLVTVGTAGGFTITGEVSEVFCECTVLRLAPGAFILPPGVSTPLVTTQPTFICCNDIEFLVKETLLTIPTA